MRMVDSNNWTEGDYARAIMLYAAHMITLDANASCEGGGQRVSSVSVGAGSVSVSFDTKQDVGSLASTKYGSEFSMLRRLNVGGPRTTGATL